MPWLTVLEVVTEIRVRPYFSPYVRRPPGDVVNIPSTWRAIVCFLAHPGYRVRLRFD
jgi:hypothetical protein